MKKLILLSLILIQTLFADAQGSISPASIPSIKGYWTFDNTTNLTQATVGTALSLVGSHQSIAGPSPTDYAVQIGVGSYYRCFHNIAANGSGTEVNRYTLLVDFRINQSSLWYSFYQTQPANNNDAEVFINTSGQIGVAATGYSYSVIAPGEWYRLVISVYLGTSGGVNHFDYYLDGSILLNGTMQAPDDRFSLFPSSGQNELLLFADDNGEDNSIDIAQVAIFDTDLTASEILSLGGYQHQSAFTATVPYLQTPTPTSVYVSWHSVYTTSTLVQYGTTSSLGLETSGNNEDIAGNLWHTVKLSGLNPDTKYFYRVISGSDTSEIYSYKTLPNTITPGSHLRFGIIGDSRTDTAAMRRITTAMKNKFQELYGTNWMDEIDMVLHVGDIVTNGGTISQYKPEYFMPLYPISGFLPTMVSIGNHEDESGYYYSYMKYDDFSDYSYPNPLTERYYTYKAGNAQFIFLNPNSIYQTFIQTDWLESKLEDSKNDPNIDFVFVMNHFPGHSELWPDGNYGYVQNSVIPKLQEYGKTTLCAYGHSHNYEQGVVESIDGSANGDFVLMLSGGGGGELDRWGMYDNQTNYSEIHRALDIYNFQIVDIDMDNKSYILTNYSLGNPDDPTNTVELGGYHRYINRPEPNAPIAIIPDTLAISSPTLVASNFSGEDSLMTSQFQVTVTSGNYSSPIVNSTRDWEDVYGNTGNPNYDPIDLNLGIDLQRLTIPITLVVGNNYFWRVRYRDHNYRWSPWSEEKTFTVVNSIEDHADFAANVTSGIAPLTVHFTDLSVLNPTAWDWDFNGDMIVESHEKDPIYTFTEPGIYSISLTSYFSGQNLSEQKVNYIDVLPSGIEDAASEQIICSPNPFNRIVHLTIEVPCADNHVTVDIYDNIGKYVTTIYDGGCKKGKIKTQWDGKNNFNEKVNSGVYYCKITSKDLVKSVKLVYID